MKKLLLTLILSVLALTGCASGGNQAFTAAHKSAADRGIAEAQSRQKADETLALAVASAGKGCEADLCRGMAMMALMSMKAAAGAAIQSAAPVIQAPVNEAVEVFKDITKTALGLYGLRINGALGLVNATRGAADIDAAKAGLSALDVYRAAPTE